MTSRGPSHSFGCWAEKPALTPSTLQTAFMCLQLSDSFSGLIVLSERTQSNWYSAKTQGAVIVEQSSYWKPPWLGVLILELDKSLMLGLIRPCRQSWICPGCPPQKQELASRSSCLITPLKSGLGILTLPCRHLIFKSCTAQASLWDGKLSTTEFAVKGYFTVNIIFLKLYKIQSTTVCFHSNKSVYCGMCANNMTFHGNYCMFFPLSLRWNEWMKST